jgi:hypothetical protein
MLTAVEPAARHLVETRYPCSASTPVSTKPVHRRLSEPQIRHPTDNQPPMNPGGGQVPPLHTPPRTPTPQPKSAHARKHSRCTTQRAPEYSDDVACTPCPTPPK